MDIKNKKEQEGTTQPANKKIHRVVIGGYVIFGVLSLATYIIASFGLLALPFISNSMLIKLSLAGIFIAILMVITRLTERIVDKRAHNKGTGYNIKKIIRFVAVILSVLIVISFLKSNWYAAAVSLGLISLLLGFALQTPIASLIGWLYIVLRTPFRIGDRIQVGSFTGDVVEINYIDTTLWEFAGDYMTNDLPSGRLIRFPNSMIFTSEVYNYSWIKFPYIWNEIPFYVAFESDLTYVEETVKKVAAEELGEKMHEKIELLKTLIEETPIDELLIKDYPFVQFKTNANTWIEVLLIYLAEPKTSASLRSRLTRKVIAELLKQPDRVLFPKSAAR